MIRIVKTQNKPKLTELSLKQREMLMAYRYDTQYLEGKVTWRELIQESKNDLPKMEAQSPTVTPRPSGM